MSLQVLEPLLDLARWSALAPDSTPSTAVTAALDAQTPRPYAAAAGISGPSLRFDAGAGSRDHRLRCLFPVQSLAAFDELRLWLASTRAADGSAASPLFLELRLGSAASPVGAAANPWHRRLPLPQRGRWELVELSLADLPAAVRDAVNQLEIRVRDASASFTLHLGHAFAVREEWPDDVEEALRRRLDNRFQVAGAAVRAVIEPEAPPNANDPFFRIVPRDLRPLAERSSGAASRVDFEAAGYRLKPAGAAYELTFDVRAEAATRAERNRLVEHLLRELAPRAELLVAGAPAPVELAGTVPFLERDPGAGLPPLRFSVKSALPGGPSVPVEPVQAIDLGVEDGALAPAGAGR